MTIALVAVAFCAGFFVGVLYTLGQLVRYARRSFPRHHD